MTENYKPPKIGDVFYMQFRGSGHEQYGRRPGLVFQNNIGNRYSPNIIALPFTGQMKKLGQPTHIFIPADRTGLPRDSILLCENPECMTKDKIGSYITTLPDDIMAEIAVAALLSTSAISFMSLEELLTAWNKARSLNATTVA